MNRTTTLIRKAPLLIAFAVLPTWLLWPAFRLENGLIGPKSSNPTGYVFWYREIKF